MSAATNESAVEASSGPVLCSECFSDQGLRMDAFQLGREDDGACQQCHRTTGRKLTREMVEQLAYRFFVRGTFVRTTYGGAPVIQFNEHHHKKSDIKVPEWLRADVELIGNAAGIGFFYYGPRMWMVGEVYPLKSLQDDAERRDIVRRILAEYPRLVLPQTETFFRLRIKPKNPSDASEYDAPPVGTAGKGRLDSATFSVMYGSQDLELCVHECRVTIEDDLFLATLRPNADLQLLDLTELLKEDGTEFESLDMAVHMLFLAGEHSYQISRDIAIAARDAGFDGVVYPSYFSLARTGAMPFETAYGISIRRFPSQEAYAKAHTVPNLALFGRPLADGRVTVQCINRVILKRVNYDLHFGPVGHQLT